MPRDYNINISIGGGNSRGAFGGGNVSKTKSTLNSRGITNNSQPITENNLKRIFSVGFAFNKAQQTNEIVGAYTENRLRQKKVDVGLTVAKYGIGIAVNPAIGTAYAVGDIAYRGIQYGINIQKQNKQAEYYKELSGNNSFSGRRYGRDYI